jgi:secreted trypsin-like serine protease
MRPIARILVPAAAVLFAGLNAAEPVLAQEVIKPFGRRIVGGEKTDIKEHPWQVALQFQDNFACGGSIIAQKWVVTAAHCFTGMENGGDWRAKAGATNYTTTGSWANIERFVVHEAYNPKTFENDIALIKVKSPLPGRVIPLADKSLTLPIGQPLEVTGWGRTEEGGDAPNVLMKATVPYADPVACNDPTAYDGRVRASMICAGRKEGGVDSCQGDSGGPLVWKTADGPVLVGIVSHGEGCARKLKYGVYTRVSVYRDWIDRMIDADRN